MVVISSEFDEAITSTTPIHVPVGIFNERHCRETASSWMCVMKDCTGVENFVFARGTLISSQADVTFPYESDREDVGTATLERERWEITN